MCIRDRLYINEEEAEAIRIISDQYVHTDIGANGLAKYLANHGINKIQRQNGKNPLFDAALIRKMCIRDRLSDRWKCFAVSLRGWRTSSSKPKRYQR